MRPIERAWWRLFAWAIVLGAVTAGVGMLLNPRLPPPVECLIVVLPPPGIDRGGC